MTHTDLHAAAKRLAAQLDINPAVGGVWTYHMGDVKSILVEVSSTYVGEIPRVFCGYPVIRSTRLNPQVRGVSRDQDCRIF